MDQPVRAMSREDAFDALKQLDADGTIRLEGSGNGPQQVSLDGWNPSTQQAEDGNVAGVVVRYLSPAVKNADGEVAPAGGAAPDRLDPRNALGLVRLCQWLAENYQATELYHIGISGGGVDKNGQPRVDCHGQGRAVDFAGVRVPADEGGTTPATVSDDWGTVATAVTPGGDWPAGTGSAVSYRLDDPDAEEWSRDFFRALYGFIASQWQDRSAGPDGDGAPTSIGEGSFIMHPDHPSAEPFPHGRSAHRDHIHMQIGVTGTA